MTFTKELPTTPGFYAWRLRGNGPVHVKDVTPSMVKSIPGWPDDAKGEWCRLVPAEEVKHAWHESRNFGPSGCSSNLNEWINSRAKRVMEGKE